ALVVLLIVILPGTMVVLPLLSLQFGAVGFVGAVVGVLRNVLVCWLLGCGCPGRLRRGCGLLCGILLVNGINLRTNNPRGGLLRGWLGALSVESRNRPLR